MLNFPAQAGLGDAAFRVGGHRSKASILITRATRSFRFPNTYELTLYCSLLIVC